MCLIDVTFDTTVASEGVWGVTVSIHGISTFAFLVMELGVGTFLTLWMNQIFVFYLMHLFLNKIDSANSPHIFLFHCTGLLQVYDLESNLCTLWK